jgi:hypothetical protein
MMNLEGLTEKVYRNKSVWYENDKGEIVAKKCTIPECGEIKPIEDFSKKTHGIGQRRGECKNCQSKRGYNYRKNNRGKIAESGHKYRENNRDRIAEYRKNNSDKIAEYGRNYYVSNREKVAERTRNWKRKNPHILRLINSRRRARKNKLPDTLTAEQYEKTLRYFDGACALTGQTLNLEKEHAIPIAVGYGGTTFENCYPMARGLNQSKSNSNIFEWFKANRQRFELSQERFDKLIGWLASANAMTIEEYRDYVYWCHANPRTVDEINEENESEAI